MTRSEITFEASGPRLVQVGNSAGPAISLTAAAVRSGLTILGGGFPPREGAYEPPGVTYEIKEVQKTGDTATAVIDVLRPDVGVIDLEALAQESQKNPKEAARSTREALLRAPKVTRKRLLNLRHESDGWRVVEGLHVFQGDL